MADIFMRVAYNIYSTFMEFISHIALEFVM
jgi:hypothetical protein